MWQHKRGPASAGVFLCGLFSWTFCNIVLGMVPAKGQLPVLGYLCKLGTWEGAWLLAHFWGSLWLHPDIKKNTKNFYWFFFFSSPFLAVLGLCCCTWAFSSCSGQGLLSSCSMWAFHCAGFSCGAHAGFSRCASWLWSMGSVVVAHRLSCPLAFGIFPNQGLNLCSLCCKVDS